MKGGGETMKEKRKAVSLRMLLGLVVPHPWI
jgi:hypothetical protein